MLVRQHFPRVAPCTGAGMVTPMPVTGRLWAPITFVTIALAACKGTEPFVPVATTLHVAPSSLSFTSLGATRQVVAVVLDQRADTIKHPSVVWSSDNSGVATVSASGLVTAVGNGSAHAVATSGGLSAQVTVSVQAAAQLIKAAGDGQTGLTGYALNIAPAVVVRDAASFPVPNVAVTFAVASGGGSVTGANATTGSDGVATVGSWTVQLGTNTLTATASGSGITGNPVTLAATGVSAAYHIDVRYLTAVTPAQREAFDSAAAQWERLIYGDVPDELASFPAGTCGPGTPVINEIIDDIIIYVRLDSIDGPGKILGQAGPCLVRDQSFQPGVGVMHFDTADVAGLLAAGQFDEVVRHEMGHVLGFGTIWQLLSLVPGAGGTDPHFVGAQATAAFDRNGGQPYSAGAKVPVENCCGPGTRDGHWRETVFDTELMTGFLNGGVPNPLSVITTASMGDLGYVVNYAASEPYTVANVAGLRAQTSLHQIELGDDILRLPILVVDRRGRVTRIIRPK